MLWSTSLRSRTKSTGWEVNMWPFSQFKRLARERDEAIAEPTNASVAAWIKGVAGLSCVGKPALPPAQHKAIINERDDRRRR
jgi:hypothetical protein